MLLLPKSILRNGLEKTIMIDTNVNSLLEEFFVHLDPTWDVGYIWAMSHGETVKLRLWIHDQKKTRSYLAPGETY